MNSELPVNGWETGLQTHEAELVDGADLGLGFGLPDPPARESRLGRHGFVEAAECRLDIHDVTMSMVFISAVLVSAGSVWACMGEASPKSHRRSPG